MLPVPSYFGPSRDFFYGVVGNGSNKRILSFGSISSVSEESTHRTWTCEACKYENADLTNRSCSMCGTRDNAFSNSVESNCSYTSKSLSGDDLSDAEDDVAPTPVIAPSTSRRTSFVLRRSSIQTSMRKILSKRLEPTSEEEVTVESFSNDRTATTSTTDDDLATGVALLTIGNVGGWACPDCTFINTKELHLTCEVCGRTKPATKMDSSDILHHASLQEFLTNSMLSGPDSLTGVVDPQILSLLKFEEMASEKEYVATVMVEQKEIINDANTRVDNLAELRGILEEGEETLQMLKTFFADESKEYDAMVLLQATRAEEIEREEGQAPGSLLSRSASTPGAQRISAQVLHWHGQQRMLDEWECQLHLRKQEIDQLQSQHQEALMRIFQ